MIWNLNYLNLFLAERHNLTTNNISYLSVKDINKMGQIYKKENWNNFKKYVFFKWFDENYENTNIFINKVNSLVKKLDLELDDFEKQRIDKLLPREFTLRRSKKLLQVPYTKEALKLNVPKYSLFLYKNIKLFEKNKLFINKTFDGSIYISNSNIVFYDEIKKQINNVIYFKDLLKIELKNYATILYLKNNKNIYIKYFDNDLIFFSLKRSIPKILKLEIINDKKNKITTEDIINQLLK